MTPNHNVTTFIYVFLLLLGVFISSISQVLLKKSAQKQYESWIKEYLNFRVVGAYALFFGTTLLSVYAYRGVPLSWGPVLESTGYLYVTFFGVRLFHECISKQKAISLVFILTGIAVYAFGG